MGLYFDTEFYVPESSRSTSYHMKTNPGKQEHYLLGGVFYSGDLPTVYDPTKSQKLWIWNIDDFDRNDPLQAEKDLLKILYKIFRGEIEKNETLKTVGIGTTRFDLPALFTRSLIHDIQPRDNLYRTYLSGFPTDLSVAGIGFLDDQKFGFEPVTANELFTRYGINYQKNAGSNIWDLYDEEQYHLIERRTELEVEHTVTLYNTLVDEIS